MVALPRRTAGVAREPPEKILCFERPPPEAACPDVFRGGGVPEEELCVPLVLGFFGDRHRRNDLGRNRRFLRDVERLIASAEAFLYAASSVILLRRLARC